MEHTCNMVSCTCDMLTAVWSMLYSEGEYRLCNPNEYVLDFIAGSLVVYWNLTDIHFSLATH